MAKMTELEVLDLLTRAAAILPVLVGVLQDLRNGDATDEKIDAAHSDIQALDAKLQAIRK